MSKKALFLPVSLPFPLPIKNKLKIHLKTCYSVIKYPFKRLFLPKIFQNKTIKHLTFTDNGV